MTPALVPPDLPLLTGAERFTAGDASVLDFWRWALGDLRMNNARGYLAEFLVARAVASPDTRRVEWAAHDVTAADGTRIEVKSSAYLQSWGQQRLSTPRFGLTGPTTSWDEASGTYVSDPRGRVDVWVFALQACQDHDRYDPLSVEQWQFWARAARKVDGLGQKTCGLAGLEVAAGKAVGWGELRGAVERVASP